MGEFITDVRALAIPFVYTHSRTPILHRHSRERRCRSIFHTPWELTASLVVPPGHSKNKTGFSMPCDVWSPSPSRRLVNTVKTINKVNKVNNVNKVNTVRKNSAPKSTTALRANPSSSSDSLASAPIHILVNSCTGKMGHATAESVVARNPDQVRLVPYTFCGTSTGVAVGDVGVSGVPVELVSPSERQDALDMIKSTYPNLVIIDYTLPMAVNDNATFYCQNNVPFVMGTTGGDRVSLVEDTKLAGNYAVIAPNMGKQIVAFQSMMEMMAKEFPGCFEGYTLEVRESHQRTKVDTSGTAKAVVKSFQEMGLRDFREEDIIKVRSLEDQLAFGVPAEVIDSGHAYHTYRLTSGDGTVRLEFQHNVNGRKVYAEGTVDAALFLAGVVARGGEGGKRVFDMVDVLKAGAMK